MGGNFLTGLNSKIKTCETSAERLDCFLKCYNESQIFILTFSKSSSNFTLFKSNSYVDINKESVATLASQIFVDEFDYLKNFKESIKAFKTTIMSTHSFELCEAEILLINGKLGGLVIGFSSKAEELSQLSAATKILSYSYAQNTSESRKEKRNFENLVNIEISRSKKTKHAFFIVSFYIGFKQKGNYLNRLLKAIFSRQIKNTENYFLRSNGQALIIKNYMSMEDVILWVDKVKTIINESCKQLELNVGSIGVGVSEYPSHGVDAESLILLASNACDASLKNSMDGGKVGIAQRGPQFNPDFQV